MAWKLFCAIYAPSNVYRSQATGWRYYMQLRTRSLNFPSLFGFPTISHAINISKQTHQTFPNSLCKRPNHTSAKVPQNPQGSQNPLHDITSTILQLLLQTFDLAGRFDFFVQNCLYYRQPSGRSSLSGQCFTKKVHNSIERNITLVWRTTGRIQALWPYVLQK